MVRELPTIHSSQVRNSLSFLFVPDRHRRSQWQTIGSSEYKGQFGRQRSADQNNNLKRQVHGSVCECKYPYGPHASCASARNNCKRGGNSDVVAWDGGVVRQPGTSLGRHVSVYNISFTPRRADQPSGCSEEVPTLRRTNRLPRLNTLIYCVSISFFRLPSCQIIASNTHLVRLRCLCLTITAGGKTISSPQRVPCSISSQSFNSYGSLTNTCLIKVRFAPRCIVPAHLRFHPC
jgi:hypothetical protein